MRKQLRRIIVLAACLFDGGMFAADEPKLTLAGVRENIEFASPDGISLTLDAYIPEGPGPFPACILVHGGGWKNGNKRVYITPLFEPLAKAGFAWFSINYRLAPGHRWPACADDVTEGIKWVKAQAADYKIDPNRIALIGESAGAQLVAWVAAQNKPETRVAAVVPFYVPADFEVIARKATKPLDAFQALLNFTELNDDAWKKLHDASPINHVKPGLPPCLLIHGDKDQTVAFEQSTLLQEKWKAAGNSCDLITIPGGGHGMGGWDKLKSDYREQLVAWLKEKLK